MVDTSNNQHIIASVCKIYDGVQIDHLSMRILGGYLTLEDFTAIDELKECRVILSIHLLDLTVILQKIGLLAKVTKLKAKPLR